MARIVLTDAYIKIGGVDLSDHIASVELSQEVEEVETTAFGDSARTRTGGLANNSLSLDFHQDFAAASVDATITPLIGGTASFEVRARSTATAVSATNPKWTGTVLLTEWTPLAGAIGELSTASITWPVSGAVTRGTAP
jgi:hypothetical protein